MRAPEASTEPLSVTQVLDALEEELQSEFPGISFIGEIGDISIPPSGHLYFNLKDEVNQIAAVMWAGTARSLGFTPKIGDKVFCVGKPTIYKSRGRLQINVFKMRPAGEGELRKKFLELKAKLEKDGYFAEGRKRPLPLLPRAVGIVTSAGGAVIHDIEVKVRERFPQMKLYLVDARVQGEGAAKDIAEGIGVLNESGLVDVIIVARGGGSLEDLWAFNEEPVVKAIFKSALPVVSGVGHETDITLADLAADVRAPTPTAAAELVVPKRQDLLEAIDSMAQRLFDLDSWFYPLSQSVDDLTARLVRGVSVFVDGAKLRLLKSESEVKRLRPERVIELYKGRISMLGQRLLSAGSARVIHAANSLETMRQSLGKGIAAYLEARSRRADLLAARLDSLNPAKVLQRGYSIIEYEGRLLTDSATVAANDLIDVRLAKGSLTAEVKETKRAKL